MDYCIFGTIVKYSNLSRKSMPLRLLKLCVLIPAYGGAGQNSSTAQKNQTRRATTFVTQRNEKITKVTLNNDFKSNTLYLYYIFFSSPAIPQYYTGILWPNLPKLFVQTLLTFLFTVKSPFALRLRKCIVCFDARLPVDVCVVLSYQLSSNH